VTIKGNVLSLDAASLERIRRDVLTRTKANAGRRLAEESLQLALFRQLPEELGISLETAQDFITSSANYRMFVQSWWPDLVPEDVLARLASRTTLTLIAEGLLSAAEQDTLAESYAAPDWSVADIALLDELMALLGPVSVAEPESNNLVFLPDGAEVSELVTTADLLTDRREAELDEDRQDTFAHILVDEAQDLSPMQWRMLRRRGPQASWTIVGDAAQSSWPDVAESRKAFTELVGSAPHREYRLSTNYRSPAEVFELAAAVVLRAYPDADLPKAVRSTGIAPELLHSAGAELVGTISAALRKLSGAVEGTIGVIIPPSRWVELTGALYRDAFAEALGDRLVLVTPLGAKGLEYDAVIVVSPDDIIADSPAGERVLYVCLTRATQRLSVIDVDGGGAWRPERVS
jgi:hypothetical protein